MNALISGLRNEWRVIGRHPLTWLALICSTVFSALVVQGSPVGPTDGAGAALRWLNMFWPMFVLPFVAGAVAPIIYLREINHDMDGIIGSYPVTRRGWLFLRVGSFFLILMTACLLAEVAFLVALQSKFPDQLGKLALEGLGWLFLVQSTSCLLWASALGLVACRFASSGVIYFSAAAGWLIYLTFATLSGTPMIAGSSVVFAPLKQAMLLLDPYAATAMMGTMPDSGALQSRTVVVTAGRVIWLAISAILLHRIRAVPAIRERLLRLPRWKGPGSHAQSARPTSLHLRFVAGDKVFLLLVIGWVVMLLPEVLAGTDYVEPFSVLVPDSRDALNRVMWDMVGAIGPILLLYIADRICRMYSATRMAELYAATPHRPTALVATHLLSLLLVAAAFVALAGLCVLVAQMVGGSSIQLSEYSVQMGLVLSRLVIFAALFVAFHGLFRSRLASNLAGAAMIALGSESVASALGVQHPLARPLATPLSVPDEVWGYGGSLSAHGQIMTFWALVALAALLFAIGWHNRTLPFAQRRLSQVLRRPASMGAIALLALAGVQAARTDASLRAEGGLVSQAERNDWRSRYERRFGAWMGRGQPVSTLIRSRVDFYPAESRVNLDSAMTLMNRTPKPIERVLIGRNLRDPGSGVVQLGAASIESSDGLTGQAIYRLARPLQPGETIILRYSLSIHQSALMRAAAPIVVRDRFAALPVDNLLPVIGFEPRFRLRDPAVRRQHGLPPLAMSPPSSGRTPKPGSLRDDEVMLDSVVSTSAGQLIVAQGELVREWQADGRAFAHFRTPMPIRNMPAFFSVPWAASIYPVGRHLVKVYAPRRLAGDHPTILGTMDTLAWLSRDIRPYPGRALNVVATPEIGLTGYALPQIIELSDKFAFRAVPSADAQFDQAYRRAAHEASHQWFGHQLGHALPDERAFLVESLAKYAELVMIERRFGKGAMRALVQYERERYREERIEPTRPVVPLIDAEDGSDMYSRATLAFACLRARVGDDHILRALRQTFRSQTSGTPARAVDFVRILTAIAPEKERATVTQLLLGTGPVEQILSGAHCGRGQI